MKTTIIHCLSGGLDSITLLHELVSTGHDVSCLFFDYGQKHANRERPMAVAAAGKLGCKLHIVRLGLSDVHGIKTRELSSVMGGDGSPVVPFRNGLFCAYALAVGAAVGADAITLGCCGTDREVFFDCQSGFAAVFNRAALMAGISQRVQYPFAGMDKKAIAELAAKHGITKEDYWSCYNGGETPCGECLACKNDPVF